MRVRFLTDSQYKEKENEKGAETSIDEDDTRPKIDSSSDKSKIDSSSSKERPEK